MPKIRDVSTLLGYVDNGRAARSVNEAFAELMDRLTAASAEAPKAKIKGSLTVTFGLVVSNGSVEVTVTDKTKAPDDPGHAGLYFVDRDGHISTEHPTQIDMFPRGARRAERVDADGVILDDDELDDEQLADATHVAG